MHLHIRHRTVYRYQGPISHATQIVRMTPRPFAGLRVINWRLKGETRRPLLATTDGFDNILHVHNVQEPKGWTAIFVEGEVQTTDTHGVVGPSHGTLPPPFFLRTTAQTSPTPQWRSRRHTPGSTMHCTLTSSAWPQLWSPTGRAAQSERRASSPRQATSSSQMAPTPSTGSGLSAASAPR